MGGHQTKQLLILQTSPFSENWEFGEKCRGSTFFKPREAFHQICITECFKSKLKHSFWNILQRPENAFPKGFFARVVICGKLRD